MVLLIKPIVFLTFSLSTVSLDLKVPNVSPVGTFRNMKMTGMFVDPLTGRNADFGLTSDA